MKKITALLIFITVSVLSFFVLFPNNFGEHTPIWELKERYFGAEYGELRSQYFITLWNRNLWHKTGSIFYIGNDHDSLSITEVYLKIPEEIADGTCKITTSGMIWWEFQEGQGIVRVETSALTEAGLTVYVSADILRNRGLSVDIGGQEYLLGASEKVLNDFEAETGINGVELLETVSEIRCEYVSALQKLSEAEYQKVCSNIYKTIINLVVIWGIYTLFYIYIRMRRKRNHLQF